MVSHTRRIEEEKRKKAEEERKKAEEIRELKEKLRRVEEEKRQAEENRRKEAEIERAREEERRKIEEEIRQKKEEERQREELKRRQEEEKRRKKQTKSFVNGIVVSLVAVIVVYLIVGKGSILQSLFSKKESKPTISPESTETPKPTTSPESTETPKPTISPESTETPKATITPESTGTSALTNATEVPPQGDISNKQYLEYVISNVTQLAETAYMNNNFDEAFEYYMRAATFGGEKAIEWVEKTFDVELDPNSQDYFSKLVSIREQYKNLKEKNEASEATIKETEIPPTLAEKQEIIFTKLSFVNKKQRFDVYSAPSHDSWRGANGRAQVVATKNIEACGKDGDWLMIKYLVDRNSERIGYIYSEDIDGAHSHVSELDFASQRFVLAEERKLTDDPRYWSRVSSVLPKGTELIYLGQYTIDDKQYMYVETLIDEKKARGFIEKIEF